MNYPTHTAELAKLRELTAPRLRQIDVRAIDLENLGICIAFVNTDSPARKDAAKANARLISSAPGLLEKLQYVVEVLSAEGYDVADLRETIAKAIGSAA